MTRRRKKTGKEAPTVAPACHRCAHWGGTWDGGERITGCMVGRRGELDPATCVDFAAFSRGLAPT